ncbi:MAG TPA: response regulator [Gemmatimonadaceae bacterium]|nr:response regulator [Gemmatimonadaceae bacterium]
MNERTNERSATVLIATEGEWTARALETVLVAEGYGVRRAPDSDEALRLARRTKPDAIILDQHTPGIGGIEVCRQLREDPTFDAATPIVLLAGAPPNRVDRADAYAAGAWSYCAQPVDTEILVRELSTFIRAKRAVANLNDATLVDPVTGLLSPLGLEQWAEKLAARAFRKHEPLACVVLMAVTANAPAEGSEAGETGMSFVELSRAYMRQSDIVGRTSDGRLAMLAPDTDGAGVLGFVQRLRSAMEGEPAARQTAPGFRAGYYAIDDFASVAVEPAELIRRATRAVEHAHRSSTGELAMSFNQLPLN